MATAEQIQRLQAVVPAAQDSMRTWGVPASVTLAQWIFESSWGTSQLALRASNFFGVKYSAVRGQTDYVEMPTAEYESGKRVMVVAHFAKYFSAEKSFYDHAALLARADRYKPVMAVCGNPTMFATRLGQCGYSTDPEYGNKLIAAIREYGLAQYDVGVDAGKV